MAAIETRLRGEGARIIVIDTSGTADFEGARGVYLARGYVLVARIPDFWADGDDKVTFAKRL